MMKNKRSLVLIGILIVVCLLSLNKKKLISELDYGRRIENDLKEGELLYDYDKNGKHIMITKERILESNVYFVDVVIDNIESFNHILPSKVRDGECVLGHINSKETVSDQVREFDPIVAINSTAFTSHSACTDDETIMGKYHIEGCNNNILLPTWGPIGSDSIIQYFPRKLYQNEFGTYSGWIRSSLILDKSGYLKIVEPTSKNSNLLRENKLPYKWLITYGPILVNDSKITNEAKEYVNYLGSPLTSIGQKKGCPNKFLIIIVDGRLKKSLGVSNEVIEDSIGLNINQLAELYKERGYDIAYNLDGGGSTILYYDYENINIPVNGLNMDSDLAGCDRKLYDSLYIER